MCPGDPIDWNEDQLSLGNPSCMDNSTFLEWSQRQLESEEETEKRHEEMVEEHKNWHRSKPYYISACFINMGAF